MEKITVVEIVSVIVIILAAIGMGIIMDLLAEKFHEMWLEIAGLILSVMVVIVGMRALTAWTMQATEDVLGEAMSKGYPVYINGIKASEEEAREAIATSRIRIDDEAQMVQIATITNMRNRKKMAQRRPL